MRKRRSKGKSKRSKPSKSSKTSKAKTLEKFTKKSSRSGKRAKRHEAKRLEAKKRVLEKLRMLGEEIYVKLAHGEFPSLKIPSRSTSNIVYDPKLRQYVLGDKFFIRSARNIRHIRPLTQLIWVAYTASTLCKMDKTSTLRDIYYMAQADGIDFRDQQESDEVITELETVLGMPREEFNIFPEERSAIFGDLTIEYTVRNYRGVRVNLTMHPDGLVIGPTLTSAEFVKCNADKVIVIEKGAMFTRFVEEQVHKRFKAILIHTAGQPPRATRRLIRRLNVELGLPVYVFVDGDPWGMHIAQVILSGSARAGHIPELATPDAQWAGVYASDIVRYKLPSDPLTKVDLKRLDELKRDPRYKGDLWQKEINTFLKIRRKSEQEAFSRYGLTFIVNKYLPKRLKELSRR